MTGAAGSLGGGTADRFSRLRAVARGALFLLANLTIVPLYAIAVGPFRSWQRGLQLAWCRAMCAAAGLRVEMVGEQYRGGPILFVANHISYLDIPVVSGAVEGCFVAKAEVADWPIFGTVGKVTRAVFIKRVGAQARTQRDEMLARLLAGENLILFAEGTSTDGSAVAPFKSSLFGIAERLPPGLGLTIQPLSIAYTHDADGAPLNGRRRALYGWFGDATMAPHIWRVLGMKGCRAELRFHPPITVAANADRKQLAAEAQAMVAAGVAAANAAMGAAIGARSATAMPLSATARAVAGAGRQSGPAAH
jgi:1-acyl-sn-glycerol-3-phosphate acyltransferase